ncbi:MAG TPA: cysteine desulfurase-like protein [Pseudonocardiaceae bacterium]
MSYDVTAVRAHFPALLEGAAHFDGPGGSQVPDTVADAVAGVLRAAVANRGTVTTAERRADAIVLEARLAAADLVGGEPGGVVFGRSMTQVTYDLARALSRQWSPGDEVVVTRLDHDGNIRPWVHAARDAGATVRWADFDPASGVLDVGDVTAVLSPRTRLVAVTAASNLLGTRPDVAAIAAAAHSHGALVYVDGVHLTPHALVDRAALGADFYACSPYKFLGPHLGFVVAAPELLTTLEADRLLPMTDAVPERFELGTLPYELLAGCTAAIDFLAGLVPGTGPRRERLAASFAALAEHEDALRERLEDGLAELDRVVVHGDPKRSRTPTTLFSVDGLPPRAVHEALAAHRVNAPAGSFYALEAARRMGLGDTGAVRAGIAPYTSGEDVDRLLGALATVIRS